MFTTILALLLIVGCAPTWEEKCVEAYTSLAECAPDLAPGDGSPESVERMCSMYDLAPCDSEKPTFDAAKCEEAWAAIEEAEELDLYYANPCKGLEAEGKI